MMSFLTENDAERGVSRALRDLARRRRWATASP